MNADELTRARTRNEYLQQYYAEKANGYHPECEPICVSEAAEMLPVLLEHINAQDKQLAALKAALITERAYHLYYKCQGDCGRAVCSAGTHKKDAIIELARKMPEIFKEDKQ